MRAGSDPYTPNSRHSFAPPHNFQASDGSGSGDGDGNPAAPGTPKRHIAKIAMGEEDDDSSDEMFIADDDAGADDDGACWHVY